MSFPYEEYKQLLKDLMPAGATLVWRGDPDPFYTPIGGSMILVTIDVGDSFSYGTSEVRKTWVPEAANGDGAYATYVLQRMTWPLTIEVETLDSSNPGESFLMILRNKMRWPNTVARIQDMGLTTIKVADVNSTLRLKEDVQTFVATLNISHGQCFALQCTDDDGNVINTVVMGGTLTGGTPDPIHVGETATVEE